MSVTACRRTTLASVESRRDNNFDVIRLVAAGLVLFSHSFPLTGRHEPLAPHTLGRLGVEIFFATSGFLVARSWFGDPSARRFAAKRGLRIVPGLAVAVLVTALVIGPIFSDRSPAHYFASSAPWAYAVVNVLTASMYVLPSVFAHNPFPSANGSLWSLPLEVLAYVLLATAASRRAFRSPRLLLAGLGTLAAASVAAPGSWGLRLIAVFFGGVAYYVFRDRVTLRPDLALVLALLWIGTFTTRYSAAVAVVALPYLVTFFAYRSPARLRRLAGAGDVSYGVYVYSFPLQQSLVAALGPVDPLLLFGLAAPIVWLIGLASWRLVERPALARKPVRQRRVPVERGAPLAPPASVPAA